MYPVTSRFLAAVAGSHRIAVDAWVESLDVRLASLAITSGSVEVDSSRAIRRTCRVTLYDETGTLTPASAGDVLTPYGNEIGLARGVAFDDGTTELAPLGKFVITKVDIGTDSGGVRIDLEGSDRAVRIQRNRWVDPYTVAAGTETGAAIAALLTDRWPAVDYEFPDTGYATPLTVFQAGADSDPWNDAQSLAESAGYVLYFDSSGVASLEVPATVDTPPVLTYGAGEIEALLSGARSMSADSIYNGVIASGENSSMTTPVRAEVWDDNPMSPTYRLGPLGQIPRFYSSPLLTSVGQCSAAATTILNKRLGQDGELTWDQVVNPAHDTNDVIVALLDNLKVSGSYVLDRLTIPMSAGSSMAALGRLLT